MNENKQKIVRNREGADVRFELAIMRAEAGYFLSGSAYDSQYFWQPFWVAQAVSCSGEGVLAMVDCFPVFNPESPENVQKICFGRCRNQHARRACYPTCAFTRPDLALASGAVSVLGAVWE